MFYYIQHDGDTLYLHRHFVSIQSLMNLRSSIRIHFWVDLPHVYNRSPWKESHSQGYRNYFCLPRTSDPMNQINKGRGDMSRALRPTITWRLDRQHAE